MKGSECLRAVKAYARKNGIQCRWAPQRESGSHGTLFLGDSLTVVKDLKKEIGPGLLAAMCKQIGIRKEDLYCSAPLIRLVFKPGPTAKALSFDFPTSPKRSPGATIWTMP